MLILWVGSEERSRPPGKLVDILPNGDYQRVTDSQVMKEDWQKFITKLGGCHDGDLCIQRST